MRRPVRHGRLPVTLPVTLPVALPVALPVEAAPRFPRPPFACAHSGTEPP
ncbi:MULTISPECIES: hypothetical protein [unclassified Nonomuraea]|nr:MULTISPECIES: hypothetical protein [unclassified Nonomuraea]NBE95585.1 hypothetical protein [Nonomuraea sp. K271]